VHVGVEGVEEVCVGVAADDATCLRPAINLSVVEAHFR
jgi:hypothetical protein